MKEENLLKISLICAIFGILIILFVSENTSLENSNISNLTKDQIETKVAVLGIVEYVTETPGLLILRIKDNTGNITIIAFKEDNITIEKGQLIYVEGKLVEYKNELEIQADLIKLKSWSK